MENNTREAGRPTVMTDEVIRKLEEVFALGGTDLEACLFADISKSTLYDYQVANPAFVERKEKLKEQPILKARQTVVKSLDNSQSAQWYLERKRKVEFSPRVEQEHSNPDGNLKTIIINKHAGDDKPTA